MAKIDYPEGPLEREYLRDALRRQGKDSVDAVAEAIQRRWHHSPLRAYRLARELSLEEVCKQVNLLSETFAEEAGYFRPATLSRYEYWPTTPKSRRPTVGHLVALAQVYRTSPRNLIADTDWTKIAPVDRYAIEALDAKTPATATGPTETVGMMETTQRQAGRAPDSPHTPWATPDPTRPGNPREREILMTGEESARYGDRGSNVGETMLDQLHIDSMDLSRRSGALPRMELFNSLRLLRDRLFTHLDAPGRTGTAQTRDLHFLAGAACGMLAVVTQGLGYPGAALSHVQTGLLLAKEAGADSLTAWLRGQQAMTYYWNGQHTKARDTARLGSESVSDGTVSVFLPAMEARATAALNDQQSTRAAVRRAEEARDHLQPNMLDEFGGLLSFDQAKQNFYAASAFLGIADNAAVVTAADAAVREYDSGPAEEYNYPNVALVRLHAAVAQIRSDDLHAARHFALAALETPAEYCTSNTSVGARQLYRHLGTDRFRESALANETRDQIEEFLSVAPARLELS